MSDSSIQSFGHLEYKKLSIINTMDRFSGTENRETNYSEHSKRQWIARLSGPITVANCVHYMHSTKQMR